MAHLRRTDPRIGKRRDWRRRGGSWTGREAYRNRETDSAIWGVVLGDSITDNRLVTGTDALTTQAGGASE